MGDLDPHIYAVAEEAFTKMEREGRNQVCGLLFILPDVHIFAIFWTGIWFKFEI